MEGDCKVPCVVDGSWETMRFPVPMLVMYYWETLRFLVLIDTHRETDKSSMWFFAIGRILGRP